jgi:SAM-dependent methyltransferase
VSREDDRRLLSEQIAYYEARASEYDRMLAHSGGYHGRRHTPPGRGDAPDDDHGWERLVRILEDFRPTGHVLEIACGTGAWTQRLALSASCVTAIDASASMIEINRQRTAGSRIEYVVADVFDWTPDRRHDAVFFAFWLSHVPPGLFEAFFEIVGRCLAPGARFLFFDEMQIAASVEWEQRLDETTGATYRTLEDGRGFRMVKVYYEPEPLAARLRGLGWEVEVAKVSSRFLAGSGTLPPPDGGRAWTGDSPSPLMGEGRGGGVPKMSSMLQRLGAGVAAVVLAALMGNVPTGPPDTPAFSSDAASCPVAGAAAWSRLVAHVPEPVWCQPPQQAAGVVATASGGTIIERSSRNADLTSFALAIAPVSGQNFTLLASGSLRPVPARCRLTVSPNPGALVLPNPRNGAVVLVCRNQPRP